ncbi:MAG: ABC transporter permease [Betaproteobacteria bacterium]|nr:ABC transporter permease [Betaproteobacteria bacterium]
MLAAAETYRGFRGYFDLAADVVRHLRLLRVGPVRDVLLRQIQLVGVATLSAMAVRAAGVGTVIIAYTTYVLAADPAFAVRILVWAVLREIGPLFAVIMLIVRSGTAIAAELALMRERGELDGLRMMGISARDYIAVPTVVAMALSNLVVTFYFQLLAVGGGILISALLMDVSIAELGEHFFALASLWDILYTVIKSLGFGILVGLVVCMHGLGLAGGEPRLPDAVSRSVMQSIVAVLGFNAVFAYLVFGVLLFGIVRAP